ncbi:MAG: hypothetical protein Q8M02_10260 [Candidatus Didemnitutus sp.]|nr:hypothetical protein [Candidatus Didemnitutus sp.]
MPFPLAFPTAIFPANVRVTRRTAAQVSESPTSYTQQVSVSPGERWEIDVTMQKMGVADAAAFTQFFYDLRGRVGTFTFDLTPHCPGLSPAPGAVTFRLSEQNPGWDSTLAREFGFTFSAVEAL